VWPIVLITSCCTHQTMKNNILWLLLCVAKQCQVELKIQMKFEYCLNIITHTEEQLFIQTGKVSVCRSCPDCNIQMFDEGVWFLFEKASYSQFPWHQMFKNILDQVTWTKKKFWDETDAGNVMSIINPQLSYKLL